MHTKVIKCFAALLFFGVVAGCSSKEVASPQSQVAAFSNPPTPTAAQRAAYYQTQADNFKRQHPERFVDGKITGPGGTVSGPAISAP